MKLIYAIGIFLGFVVCLSGAYTMGQHSVKPSTDVVATENQEASSVDTGHTTTTIVHKTDGTTISTTTEDKHVVATAKTETRAEEHVITALLPRFSLGGGVVADVFNIRNELSKDMYISGAVRTLGNVWLESEYRWKAKEVSVGIRVEM